MTVQNLGRLEEVDLRSVWAGEATKFTPWLAEEDNLDLLGDTLGMDLALEAQEKDVGSFSADMLCKNTLDDSWIVIENQLEKTDHSHLGQILTYAAGLSAVTVIWIAQRFTDEHRAALDWLNEISTDSAQFFGIEIEVWRIGESLPAPKFNIVAKPNEWSRSEKSRAQGLTPNRQMQLDFWRGFREFILDSSSSLKPGNPQPLNYMNFSLGRSGFWLAAIASFWISPDGGYERLELRAELGTNHNYSDFYYEQLLARRSEVEQQIGSELIWHNRGTDYRVRKVYAQFTIERENAGDPSEQYAWLVQNLERLRNVYEKHLQTLDGPPENHESVLASN